MSRNEEKIPVICYHNIGTKKEINAVKDEDKQWIINNCFFEKQIKLISRLGYKTLQLQEFEKWKKGEIKLPYKSMLITFDDGFLNVYKYAMPILKRYNINATVFIEGNRVNNNVIPNETNQTDKYLSKDIINKCKEEYPNMEFACHSYGLHVRRKC